MSVFRALIEECIKELSIKDQIREDLIKISREIIKNASSAIHALQVGDFSEAKEDIEKLRSLVDELNKLCENFPEFLHAGYVSDCLAEYVEAVTFYRILQGEDIKGYRELKVPVQSYLCGLGDVVGELRRAILSLLIKNDLEKAEKLLKVMNDIVAALSQVHFPDALVPGLRRKCDIGRRILEETIADYLRALERKRMEDYAKKLLNKLEKTSF